MDNETSITIDTENETSNSGANRIDANDGRTLTNILHIIIGIIGVLCNTMIWIVVFKFAPSKTSRVNLFILNQATIDLFSSLLMIIFGVAIDPNTHSGPLGVFLCLFWAPGSDPLLFMLFAVSTYNLTIMSVERFIAVLYPIQYRRVFNKRFCMTVIIITWIVAPIAEYMFPVLKNTVEDGVCTVKSTWTKQVALIVGVFLFHWEFVLPCCIMTVAYLKIIKTLTKKELVVHPENTGEQTNGQRRETSEQAKNSIKARKNVVYTFFSLFVVYVICWAPNQITFLQFNLGGPLDTTGTWFHFTVIWAFFNTFSNTFVFVFRHKQFQNGLKKLLRCSWTETQTEETVMTVPSVAN